MERRLVVVVVVVVSGWVMDGDSERPAVVLYFTVGFSLGRRKGQWELGDL